MPEQNDYATELYHYQEVFRMKFVPYNKTPKFLQPGKKSFHLPASTIAPQCPPILSLAPISRCVACISLQRRGFSQEMESWANVCADASEDNSALAMAGLCQRASARILYAKSIIWPCRYHIRQNVYFVNKTSILNQIPATPSHYQSQQTRN